MQNIPSHERAIRLLFQAQEGYSIVGADFSGQEPRVTSNYSQDQNMINAYLEHKDLYAVIASLSFDCPYEDCLEFYPEGTKIMFEGKEVVCGYKTHQNVEGKKRRTQAKGILLGLLYGRGSSSIGEQIGKSREEAQEIIDKFFKAFPKVKKWIDTTISDAKKNGYVEDMVGRRRRLPDILLPKYEVTCNNKESELFNPFLNTKNRENSIVSKYIKDLESCKYKKDIDAIKQKALSDNVTIKDNSGFIAQAERQAVNARVQGGAATITKNALICIANDQRLKDLGAFLVNAVHDEILIEVPKEYSELAGKYLCEDMINSAKDIVKSVPMEVDYYNVTHWYADEMSANIKSEYKKLCQDHTNEEALQMVKDNHEELYDYEIDNLILHDITLKS